MEPGCARERRGRTLLSPGGAPMRVSLVVPAILAAGSIPLPDHAAETGAAVIVEYVLPRPENFPHDPAVAADGTVWYTDQRNSYIGHLDPATGKVTDYATPTPGSGPHGIVVAPDGGVWYTGNAKGNIGRLDPATGAIKEFLLPSEVRDPHTPLFHAGRLWFTVQGANLYARLDPATGAVAVFHMPTGHSLPYGFVAAPDGSLFIAE